MVKTMRGTNPLSRWMAAACLAVCLAACTGDSEEGTLAQADTAGTVIAEAPMIPVRTTFVTYGQLDSLALSGYLAVPERPDSVASALGRQPGDTLLPALVVVHDAGGRDDNAEEITRRLAGEGFLALAVDLYPGNQDTAPGASQAILGRGMPEEEALLQNVRAAAQYLRTQLRAPAVGIVGWGVGGQLALGTALTVPDELDAAVVYYAPPEDDRELLQNLGVPLLAFYGGQDDGISAGDVQAFEEALRELGKPAEVHVYDSAGAAFANPLAEHYAPDAAQDAWTRTTAFLRQHLYADTTAAPPQ